MVQGDFFMKNKMIKKMTFASMISAVYFVLCLIEGYIASGPVANIRFAEGLIVFALFVPETILGGLFVILTNKLVKKENIKLIIFGLGLVIFNAFIVPIVLILNIPDLNWGIYWYEFMVVGVGELIAVYSIGIPLYFASRKIMKEKYL